MPQFHANLLSIIFYPPIQDEYLGTLPESCNSYPKNRSLSIHCSPAVVFVMEAANLAMFPMTRTLLLQANYDFSQK